MVLDLSVPPIVVVNSAEPVNMNRVSGTIIGTSITYFNHPATSNPVSLDSTCLFFVVVATHQQVLRRPASTTLELEPYSANTHPLKHSGDQHQLVNMEAVQTLPGEFDDCTIPKAKKSSK
jgi:hypothetical protein